MGPTALLPYRRKSYSGFLRYEKIHRPPPELSVVLLEFMILLHIVRALVTVKVKISHYRHESPRRMWMQGSTYSIRSHGTRESKRGWPFVRALLPGESHYSFYRRLSGLQDQSGREEKKKILHTSTTRDRTQAVQSRNEASRPVSANTNRCDVRAGNLSAGWVTGLIT